MTGSVDILLDRIFWLVEEALMGRLRTNDREVMRTFWRAHMDGLEAQRS